MFIDKLFFDLTNKSRIIYYSPNGGDIRFDEKSLAENPEIFRDKKGCFAPIRFFVNIPDLEKSRIVLHLRDPRDVLVSLFYSYVYIHKGEIAPNTGYRKTIGDNGIDAFCLKTAKEKIPNLQGDYGTGNWWLYHTSGNILKRYEDYIKHLIGRPNVTVIKYEEMVTDFKSWLKKIIKAFNFRNEDDVVNSLFLKYNQEFKIKTETMVHRRKITPGDHKEKLKPETIKELNSIFRNVLEVLGYN
jgi:hypothetical protein